MPKVTLTGHILVKEHDLETVLSELPTHIKLTQAEAGCVMFQVKQDQKNNCILNVNEEFADQAAFEFHQARTKDSSWAKVTANAERHFQISQLD